MGELKEWYQNIDYESAKIFLSQNIKTMTRSFVAVGYYLKYIRDTEGFREDGYGSVWEFADQAYGLRRSTASRWMAINDRFSKDGNSPILVDQYRDFGRSQLQEMLYLTDEQLEEVTPDMTVKEIRQIGKPEPVEVEPEVLVSVLGYPRRVYPEDSLISTPGCGNQDCDSCHRAGCEIRGKECYCVEAPMGNPFPCTVLEWTETLRQEIGNVCQFVNSDLAYIRPGDGQPVPCCKECDNPCGYECKRSAAKRGMETADVKCEPQRAEEQSIDELDFSVHTYNILKEAGINTVEQLKSMDRNQLVMLRGMGARGLIEIEKALGEYQGTDQEAEECATSHTDPSGKCIHRLGYQCTLSEQAKQTAGNGSDCHAKCCWNCGRHGDCKMECYASASRPEEEKCATPHTEEERLPGQMYVKDSPEMMSEQTKDEAWFVREYFQRHGGSYLPTLMRICRENKSNSDRAKAAQKLIAPYGCAGGWGNGFGHDFHGFSGGIDFETAGTKLHMKYGRFVEEMLKLYDPWDPKWMPDEPEEPEKDPEQMEIVSGEVENAVPEGSEMVAASEEPHFTSLFVRDILWDKENELNQMEECNAQPDGKLPDRMMQEHRAVVAGLRLLLELTEMQENREETDDEEYTKM